MVKKIISSLLFGILATIFFAQFDPWVHDTIVTMGQHVACTSLGCNAQFSIESINFFSPSIVLSDVEMTALNNTWSWKCKKCQTYFSWAHLLLTGTIERFVVMEDFECVSSFSDNKLAIEPHIVAMMGDSFLPIPTDIKSCIFKNSRLVLCDEKKSEIVSLCFNSSSLKVGDKVRTRMSLYDGTVTYNDVLYSKDITADISAVTWFDGNSFMYGAHISGLLNMLHMNDQGTCYLSGVLECGRGRIAVRNPYGSFVIDPIIITDHDIRIESYVPLSYLMRCCQMNGITGGVNGFVTSSVRIDKQGEKIDGHCIVQDVCIAEKQICDVAKIGFASRDDQWKFRLNVARNNEDYKGTGYWDRKIQQGQFEFFNNTPFSFCFVPHWRIMHKNLLCHGWINCDEVVGIYKADTINTLSKAHHTLYGGFSLENNGDFFLSGLLDMAKISLHMATQPHLVCKKASFIDKEKKELFLINESEEGAIKGRMMFAFVRGFINTFFHYDVQGEGIFGLKGAISSQGCSLDVSLDEATIRLPETYNFIDGLRAHMEYNMSKRLLTVQDVHVSLHTGALTSLYAKVLFDDQGKIESAYAPFLLDRCLFTIKKDLFAIISGNLFFSHVNIAGSDIRGNIIIDRAQLKENIFSSVIQKRLFSYTNSVLAMPGKPVRCDLVVETKSPIKVDTAFLQTNAKVNLAIQNTIMDPTFSGTITLQSGNLIFPYKSLLINKGVLTFSPGQLFDPAIELVARSKIKNYDIALQVAGSLAHHHIMLDSTPPLSEEQIMTLLLVGSQESSLNSMIPALIAQNLKNLIFSNNQASFLEKYFAPLLRPFNISLVPSFTDQTGRGGLRGMLEISMDDRWKAMIQKNFNLTEDTRVELEFLLSDDIALRGIRDERRDLGGEIEMKWKF